MGSLLFELDELERSLLFELKELLVPPQLVINKANNETKTRCFILISSCNTLIVSLFLRLGRTIKWHFFFFLSILFYQSFIIVSKYH